MSVKVAVRRRAGADAPQRVQIHTEFIKLQDFLKFVNVVESGGMAKTVIQEGAVEVNGEPCTMRGKKLRPGDTIRFGGEAWVVAGEAEA